MAILGQKGVTDTLSIDVNMHSETLHTDTPNFLLAQKSCQGRRYRRVVPLPVGGLDTNHRHEGGITPLTSIGPLGSVANPGTPLEGYRSPSSVRQPTLKLWGPIACPREE